MEATIKHIKILDRGKRPGTRGLPYSAETKVKVSVSKINKKTITRMEEIIMAKQIKVLGKCDPAALNSIDIIHEFILAMIIQLGMRALGEPTIHDVHLDISKLNQKPFQDEGGITAQIVGYGTLSTSHIAIHTFPLREEFYLDIYSCRTFDMSKAIDLIQSFFKCRHTKITDLSEAAEW